MTEFQRTILAMVLVAAWALWCVWLYWRKRQMHLAHHSSDHINPGYTLVAYASQSGTAATMAASRARQLQGETGEGSVNLLPLNQVSGPVLLAARKAVFVVSTYGEGEPPDNGVRFARNFLGSGPGSGNPQAPALDLSHLSYSVIALGDSAYAQFCAFGRRLFDGLAAMGAQALAPLEQIDRSLADNDRDKTPPDLIAPSFWKLASRRHLNPDSPGLPLFEVSLHAYGPLPVWRAGDVFVVQPRNPPEVVADWLSARDLDGTVWVSSSHETRQLRDWLSERDLLSISADDDRLNERLLFQGDFSALPLLPSREYSVASVPREGCLKLIVRQQLLQDGRLGLGSGWLTAHCSSNTPFVARLRRNENCHTRDHTRPILMIAAGSGLAGLRAQLAERAGQIDAGQAWVVFGERSASADLPLAQEFDTWSSQGLLSRCDRVFSRSEFGSVRYVQDHLVEQADQVRVLIARGGDIYVCGSREGMGEGVHRALATIVGEQALGELLETGRYRRDLY